MGKLRLTAHFEEAVRNIRAVMPDMSKKALKKSGFDFKSVPKLKVEHWNAYPDKTNCYDFARNRRGHFRFPGGRDPFEGQPVHSDAHSAMFPHDDPPMDFYALADNVREGLLRDGLIELGDKPELSERGTLVALFMGNSDDLEETGRDGDHPDIHFYALRRDGKNLVWAHKPGEKAVENLGSDPAAPFEDAPKHGDRLFGGFWLVPHRR
ncbi:MAG TPA: hypothetical protein VL625_02895 [Patescibacteria group bacterium]|nr:hypothetical protein [Patescibacteria group bacterium]